MNFPFAVALLLALTAPVPAGAEQPSFRETLDRTLPAMGAAAIPDRAAAQQEFQDPVCSSARPDASPSARRHASR